MRFDNFSAVDEGFQPFDGGFSNAIGTKTSTILINPVGYVPYKCGSNNSCGQGHRCITNGTNVATGEVGNWCVPFAEWERLMRQRAFDGGFANIAGATYVDPNSITALTTAKQEGGLIDQNNTPYSAPPIIGGWNTSTLNKFVAFPSASKPNRKLVLSYQAHIPNIQAFGANQVLPNFTPLTNNADLAVRVGNRIVNFLNNSSSLVTTMTSLKNNLSSPTLTSQQYSYYLNNFYTALASFNELGRNVIVGGTPIKAPANLYRLYVYIKNN